MPLLLAAAGTGDISLWTTLVLITTVLLALRKMIKTLAQLACIELWDRFSKRHKNAGKMTQELITKASRNDLLTKPRRWRRRKASK